MDKKTRRRLFFWARILIAAVFITVIILTVDLGKTWGNLVKTDLVYVGFAALAFLAFLAIGTFRWWILSRVRKQPYGYFYLYRSIIIHFLFNNVLPSTIGGDVYRIIDTGGHEGKGVSFSIVWTDRLTGFIGVFAFGFLASIIYTVISGDFILFAVFGGVFLLSIAITFAFMSRGINDWLSTWLPRITIFKYPIGEKIAGAFRAITEFRNHRMALVSAVLASLGVQICLVAIWYLLFLSLPHEGGVSFVHFMVTIPLVNTAAMFSIGGWGVREVAFINLLTAFSVSVTADTALANTLLFDALNVFFGLLGGVFLLLRRTLPVTHRPSP